MDIEFHYYITWLIAVRAGFSPQEARTLAWSSQYTDDNNTIYDIDISLPTEYHNYISQTMNIFKPQRKRLRIYSLFHFIPGAPSALTARRKDGTMHRLNTTPDSLNARLVMKAALDTDNLYRIGIACHAYADTWAHQNFTGYLNHFNAMSGMIETAFPNIGHVDALAKPDRIALKWNDDRLVKNSIDNNERFLEAAVCMFRRLARYADPKISGKELQKRAKKLLEDIKYCIGSEDQENLLSSGRISSYRRFSCKPEYGGIKIDKYDDKLWINEAVSEKGEKSWDWSINTQSGPDITTKDNYFWKDPDRYKQTNWYLFQEAVKEHQNNTWEIVKNRNFKELNLEDL
jgi:hypothetical protein